MFVALQDIAKLNPLLERYGIEKLPELKAGELVQLDTTQLGALMGAAASQVTELAEMHQRELGAPGQRLFMGQLQTDNNPTYGPMFVRGASGSPGLYDEVYRTEPLIYDAIRTHTETLVSGTWVIEPPKEIKRKKREMKRFCEFHNGKLRSIKGGLNKAIEHMCSMLLYGFSVHEIVWGMSEDRRPFIHKLGWRYPATVYQWIMDERQSELLGCHFRVMGSPTLDYVLPAFAPAGKPWERRLLLQNLGGWGNDFEGVAPMRSVLVLWKIKRLLVQIAALAADTYGIPILQILIDPAWVAAGGTAPAAEDIQKAWNILKNMTALDAPRAKMPAGLKLEFAQVAGQMPSMLEMIEYCDRMLLVPFSNEGSLLGMVGGGAYALGVVKERETLRTAPYYARLIVDPINEILKDLAIYEMGELEDYPRLVWRMDGAEDASAWVKDALPMMGGPLPDWPKPARAVGLDKLKLPETTFDDYDKAQEAARAQMEAQGLTPGNPDQQQAAAGGRQAQEDEGQSVTGESPADGPERPDEDAR